MSHTRKFAPPVVVASTLFAALWLTLVSSNAAQLGVQPVGVRPVSVHPTFDKNDFRAPNLGTQRTIGMVNNLNSKKNISKGVSPDG
jgi:hypothetical protein